jgi:hypothetical protein
MRIQDSLPVCSMDALWRGLSPLHIPLDIEPLLFVISVFGDVAVLVILYRIGY